MDVLILPESAVPFYGTSNAPGNTNIYSTTFHAIVAFLARYGDADVIYNELVAVPDGAGYFNLATVLSRQNGERRASYQKRRLVPFGEYIPYEEQLPVLRSIFQETSRYIPAGSALAAAQPRIGTGTLPYEYRAPDQAPALLPRLEQSDLAVLADAQLALADWPLRETRRPGHLQTLICYEGLFPELVRESVVTAKPGADFLVNMVNDSWFGDGFENHHHESGARMRAIETGRYLVRPTLTGVSASFDPRGERLVPAIPTGAADVRVVKVRRLPERETLYLRSGNWPAWIFCLLVLFVSVWRRRA